MTEPFPFKDNEFIAWYPNCVRAEEAGDVWTPRRAAYYVHIPFCTAICDYCAFAVERAQSALVPRYLEALRREIGRYAETGRLAGYSFECGHFGGGTPSVLDASQLLAINDLIRASFPVQAGGELTVEVNPISFTRDKAEAYLAGGVNRISVGIQSFDEQTLRVIGRPHRTADVTRALDVIGAAGVRNFSLDVIYGVPGQTEQSLREDLLRAAGTGATHLSCFRLDIIPFTALKLREGAGLLPARLADEQLNRLDDVVTEVLTGNGYREYGAFNYARPGFESVHNEIAFVAPQGEYVGFGNSSYSFINGAVYCNYAELTRYEEAVFAGRDPIALARRATGLEAMSRYFVLGLKFFRVARQPFIDRFGLPPEQIFGPVFDRLTGDGLLRRDGDDYVLTRTGRHYVNNVAKEFYVGDSTARRQYAQFVPNITPKQIDFYARKAGAGT